MFGARPPFSGTSSFSGFGAAPNTQQTPGFGASSFGRAGTFGAQGTDTGFGSTATSSTPFGAGATGSSLFGTSGQTTGSTGTGLFGSTNPGAFGGNTGAFNTASTSIPLFGGQNTAAPSTGLFGSTGANNAFGAQQKQFGAAAPVAAPTGGLFNTTNPGTGLFGSTAATSNIVGTTVKYQPVTGTDTMSRNGVQSNIQTRIEVITCMKEYENKSLEELRVEDYLANRKGPGQGGGLMGGTAFGQPSTTGGLFGAGATSTQLGVGVGGATTVGLFGQKPQENKTLFGTTAATGFGVPASSNSGGLFGNTNTATAFGQAATSTGFAFPLNNSNTTTNTTGGGLFGQQQQQQPQQQPVSTGFGAPNTGFSFGQTATSQPNQTVGLFNQAKPAFGTTGATTVGGLFGNKPVAAAPAFGGFGTNNTGAFGSSVSAAATAAPFGTNTNTNAGGGLFGTTQNKTGFGLGTGSTFGNPGTAFNTGTSGGGLFGSTNANTGGGLFGNTGLQNKPATGLTFNTGNTFNPGTNTLGGLNNNNNANKPTGFGALGGGFGTSPCFGAPNTVMTNNAMVTANIGDNNIANLIKALTDNPFGHSSLLKTPVAITGKAEELLNSPESGGKSVVTGSQHPPTYVLPTKMTTSIQPRANNTFSSTTNTILNNRSLLFAGLDDTNDSNAAEEIFKTKSFPSVKKLNLKLFKNLKNSSGAAQTTVTQSAGGSGASSPTAEGGRSPMLLTTPMNRGGSPALNVASPAANDSSTATPDIIKGRGNMKRINMTYKKSGQPTAFNDTIADLNVACRGVVAQQLKNGVNSSHNDSDALNASNAGNMSNANFSLYEAPSQDYSEADINDNIEPHPTGIKLTRAGYYTIPSLSELTALIDENGRCYVENFSVGREGYGNICFSSETDVMGLDLDSIIFIVRKEAEVYPDAAMKPKVGEGLNKPAVITLDAVWPIDKSSRDVIKDSGRLEALGWSRYLEKKCLNMGAKFFEYRPDTGSWVFKVNHFSKYGLQDDNDDEFSSEDLLKAQQQQQLHHQQQQQQQQNKRANYELEAVLSSSGHDLPKTTDVSLIKSSKRSGTIITSNNNKQQQSLVSKSSLTGNINNEVAMNGNAGSGEGSVTTSTSTGSLSSSSSGLGGGGGAMGGPPTMVLMSPQSPPPPPMGLVVGSPPPTHHLMPHHHSSSSSSDPDRFQRLVGNGRSTAPATVPGELFLDSFANEPDEGASLGALNGTGAMGGGGGINKTLQQLTANMFPMEEDEDYQDPGDGYGATVLPSLLLETGGPLAFNGHRAATAALDQDNLPYYRDSSIKKFASKRVEALQEDIVPEGRLSPCVGENTIVRPQLQQHTAQHSSLHLKPDLSSNSSYRAARTEYPSIASVSQQSSHPSVVVPQHSSELLPLRASLLHGQHSSIADTGAFMNASFRVGWGPAWQILHTGPALGTQVDVVGAATAREKEAAVKAKRNAAANGASSYLFMPSFDAPSSSSHLHTNAADKPRYQMSLERLHLTDLSAASAGCPDPATALQTVEACLFEVLQCSNRVSTGSKTSVPCLQPASGRSLLHRLATSIQQQQEERAEAEETTGSGGGSSGGGSSALCDVLELCMALWGKLDYSWLEDAASDCDYVQARARVETLSQWVERVSGPAVNIEVQAVLDTAHSNNSTNGVDAHLEAVFSHLTAREIGEACDVLQENGDHHLALLLAQICMGDDTSRQILSKQLSNWAGCGADTTMSAARLVLYVLASGQATYNSGSGLVNVCKGLDWRRALAVHLWYICPSTCTISEALLEYERGAGLVTDSSSPTTSYCQEPLPQYLAEHTLPDSASRVSYDICYHLLKLYTQPSYRLDQLLNPATNTPDPLDVTTSWLVMALIHSLGYTHVNPVVGNGLHLSMAAHLEAAGLWHWAIFVLLSLKQQKCREAEVRAVLSRHVQVTEGIELEDETFVMLRTQQRLGGGGAVAMEETTAQQIEHHQAVAAAMEEDDVGFVDGDDDNSMDTDGVRRDEVSTPQPHMQQISAAVISDDEIINRDLSTYEQQEAFLINMLKIPEKWINESKAILARSFKMREEEAWYLIKAGDLTRAHTLLIDTIAPSAIINEDHEYLERYITAFEASSSSLDVNVPEWKMGGGVYAHYLHILSTVEEIKRTQQPTQDKVEALRPRLLALCSQLNSLKTPTSRHRLCVSEVSRVVVSVLRAVLGEDLAATAAIANQVAALPLSHDCALQELNTLTHQYLAAVAN